MQPVWRIEMLGTLRAASESRSLTRFRTRRVAQLLAFLAYFHTRDHSREELGEMLWPDQETDTIRRNLRQALFSLRQTLEPPPLPAGSVVQVAQDRVRLNSKLIVTDVAEFEALLVRARKEPSDSDQESLLLQALSLYRGELLPGVTEEWILRERLRLEDLFVSCLRSLIHVSKRKKRHDDTVEYLRRVITLEPLHEPWRVELMEQYLGSGRPLAALKEFRDLEQLLQDELGCRPSQEAKSLALRAQRAARLSHPPQHGPRPSVGGEAALSPTSPEEVQTSPRDGAGCPMVRLPVQGTRFYGRSEEISSLCGLISNDLAQVVTILGPAGTGKSRLAIEVGQKLAEGGDWNVWFVPLADLTDASMLLDAVADAMNARQSGGETLIDQIDGTLRGARNLIILDNLEHILEESLSSVCSLVTEAQKLKVLVTSRQSLKISHEQEFPLGPLPVPELTELSAPITREELSKLAECPSVQVFLDRSQALRPDIQLTTTNAQPIAKLCRMLEGLPLAIELAAGQSSTIAPTQMLKHLGKRIMALANRRRDATPRHRSLRAAIDYSFESLSPELQGLFSRLAVFRGGFTIESALEVSHPAEAASSGLGPHAIDRDPVQRTLTSILDLYDRSLVRADIGSETPDARFWMLESFRQYGEERLGPKELEELRQRHANYFLDKFRPGPQPPTIEQRTQLHWRIDAEHENFIAAVDFLFRAEQFEACIRLLGILSGTWQNRGPRVVEREYIRLVAAKTASPTIEAALRIQLLRMLGTTYIRSSDYLAAHQTMEAALEVALHSGDRDQVATCYAGLAVCAGFLGQTRESQEFNFKVIETASPDNEALLERANLGIGAIHWAEGRLVEAERALNLAREYSERVRGGEADALIMYNLARVAMDLGRGDEAMRLVGHAVRTSERLRDSYTHSQSLSLIARHQWLSGDLTSALATNHSAMLRGRESAFGFLTLSGVRTHALILASASHWEDSTTLLAATQSLSSMRGVLDDLDLERSTSVCREALDPALYDRAWMKGLTMSAEEALRLALEYR